MSCREHAAPPPVAVGADLGDRTKPCRGGFHLAGTRYGFLQSPMRCLAIGDIHGCSRSLEMLLGAVSPRAGERIVTLGDYVNRGPDSRAVIERLLQLHRGGLLVPLRGNHEQMMLEARDEGGEKLKRFLKVDGDRTLASYAARGEAGLLADVPDEHWNFVEQGCVDWYETETHFFVHANAYPDYPLAERPTYMLRWE
jgi:serine/threonine protein phosphatase 1